ncbi:MAG: Hpt domain-containing protein [Bacteroidetes bacterium]|jgi:HPt (histidine-containing phosphotransfer) domain-containing protein|nr:Hpt domain-containing protein [Bacteroidota bacterium]MBP6402454.1 Hpt domain-containing protein [Bacteroidia bacterium]MBK9526303.1 Hpt domain-containing protein [Bacteroidota bacterium]MBK9544114.1 Hpt domain-containing protein [Bacteroidota bacterium]MBL0256789.1 Hpt domain-containing protein [Bacteroidota bacterium]
MDRQSDLTFLRTFTGGNPDKIKKYVSMFLQLCPTQLATMSSQLTEQNYSGLRATAHALKPQITYMGIRRGEELIKTIENNAGNNVEVEKLPSMLNEFQTVCNQAMDELKLDIA